MSGLRILPYKRKWRNLKKVSMILNSGDPKMYGGAMFSYNGYKMPINGFGGAIKNILSDLVQAGVKAGFTVVEPAVPVRGAVSRIHHIKCNFVLYGLYYIISNMYSTGRGMRKRMRNSASVADDVQSFISRLQLFVNFNFHIIELDFYAI